MISIVIVNWNSGPLLERCVTSLLSGRRVYEIAIVDNASEDFSLDFAARLDFPLTLLLNPENQGFAAGCNRGWRACRGEQILFLNPDTESAPDAVDRLEQLLLEDGTIWAAGGRLVGPDRVVQAGFNVRAFPTIASVAAEMLLLDEIWPGNPWTRRYRMTDWDLRSPREVDQPAGACLMVRREALAAVDGFDESFRPAWFEDVDLCRRIRDAGGRIVFEPAAEFVHHGGSSLKHLARERFLQHYHTNQIRYFRKHHGRDAAARIRGLVRWGMRLRAALSLVVPLVPNASRASASRTFWRTARYFERSEALELSPRVVVGIVTYNSDACFAACLEGLRRQTSRDLEVHLWDNASTDRTLEIASASLDLFAETHFSPANVGFSAGHNRLIAATESDYVLVLNPDVVLEPSFVEVLTRALDGDTSAGAASGKLWRLDPAHDPRAGPGNVLDTTGIYFTPNQRHFDRGSGDLDRGQYEAREYVFGASGAAGFYRRSMLEEVRSGDEYFDEAFFAYREDADLAWRAQWLGWCCLYVPEAQGFHLRRVLPERRSKLPPAINMHSLKNRFLMRVKNMDAGTYARFFVPITLRDLAAALYVLTRERTSLAALPLFWRALPRALEIRRALARHRRVPPRELRAWFSRHPVARPAPAPPAPAVK